MNSRTFLCIIFFIVLIACRHHGPAIERGISGNAGSPMKEVADVSLPATESPDELSYIEGAGQEGRRIMRSARMTVEVDDVRLAKERVSGIVVKIGGFVADSRASEDDAGNKIVSLTLNLPAERLDQALSAIRQVGRVKEEEMRGEDISEQYIDLDVRLSNSKRLEKRLTDLLSTGSKGLKDVLEVEKELARVRTVIESMESRKRYFDTRTRLATIEIVLAEPPGFGRGIFDPISGMVQRSLSALTNSVAWLVVVIAAALPWIAVLMLFSWLTLRFLRWLLRHKRAQKAKNQL